MLWFQVETLITLPENTSWITSTNGMIVIAAIESVTRAEIVSESMSAAKVIRNMVIPISTMRGNPKRPTDGKRIPTIRHV